MISLKGILQGLIIASTLTYTACDIHQFPDPVDVPVPDENPVDLILELRYSPDLYVWEHEYNSGSVTERYPEANVDGSHPGTTDIYSPVHATGEKLIYLRIYAKGDYSHVVAEESLRHDVADGYDRDVCLTLSRGEYDVVVWSDFYPHAMAEPFYDSSDFHRVRIDYSLYAGNTDYRDGYRGRARLVLGDTESLQTADLNRYEVAMRRPMGKYEFIATDAADFLEREKVRRGLGETPTFDDYTVIISYPAYHPSSYSAVDDRLENATTGVSFRSMATLTADGEGSLGFDYVLINDIPDAGVQTAIAVYDPDGERVAATSMITVPVRRDHHTIVRGEFFERNSGGGIGIDPGFNGDYNVGFEW